MVCDAQVIVFGGKCEAPCEITQLRFSFADQVVAAFVGELRDVVQRGEEWLGFDL